MGKVLVALLATLFLLGGSATMVATAQDGTPEPDRNGLDEAGTNPVDPAIGDTVTFYTEDGDEAGNEELLAFERNDAQPAVFALTWSPY